MRLRISLHIHISEIQRGEVRTCAQLFLILLRFVIYDRIRNEVKNNDLYFFLFPHNIHNISNVQITT